MLISSSSLNPGGLPTHNRSISPPITNNCKLCVIEWCCVVCVPWSTRELETYKQTVVETQSILMHPFHAIVFSHFQMRVSLVCVRFSLSLSHLQFVSHSFFLVLIVFVVVVVGGVLNIYSVCCRFSMSSVSEKVNVCIHIYIYVSVHTVFPHIDFQYMGYRHYKPKMGWLLCKKCHRMCAGWCLTESIAFYSCLAPFRFRFLLYIPILYGCSYIFFRQDVSYVYVSVCVRTAVFRFV